MERKLEFLVKEESTLYTALRKQLKLTKNQISRAKFRTDGILVNGIQTRVTKQVQQGDRVTVKLEEAEIGQTLLPYEKGTLEILYEDEDLILVNKPAGMVVHPAHGHYGDSLSNRLTDYFLKKGTKVIIRSIGRLDKDTSGIVVFAKNRTAAGRLAQEKAEGIFTKEYIACVQGKIKEDKGRIQEKIGPVPGELMKMQITEEGKPADTEFYVLKREKSYTIVRVKIYTGRTHQIRVHMAGLGHPLLGDPIYGNGERIPGRAALHAYQVKLLQPFTGKTLTVTAQLPEDMERLCGKELLKQADLCR